MKRVLFVLGNVVNRYFIPTSIPVLSAIAKKHGVWECQFFDSRDYHKIEEILVNRDNLELVSYAATDNVIQSLQNQIDTFKPDLLAITVASYRNYQYLMTVIPKLTVPKETLVIIGGSHITISPKTVLSDSRLYNLVCVGEGEGVFDDVLTRVENGQSLEGIRGTYFINKTTGEITLNDKRMLTQNVWDIDEDFSLFQDDRYYQEPTMYAFNVEASRGCPFDCNYCGNSALKREFQGCGEFIRIRPVDSLFAYLEKVLKARPQINTFRFTDECFLHKPISWLEEFSKRYAELCHRPFFISARAEYVNEKTIKILKQCNSDIRICMGVESGSDHILKEVCNRTCKVEHLRKAFKLANEAGFITGANIMVGLPYETREDAFKSIELVRQLKPHGYEVNVFVPYPGTALSTTAIEAGFVTEKETHDIKVIKMLELQNDKLDELVAYPLLHMPPPYLSSEDIINLRRVYPLYMGLPKKYYPYIEMCEKNFGANKRLYKLLTDLKQNQCGCSCDA